MLCTINIFQFQSPIAVSSQLSREVENFSFLFNFLMTILNCPIDIADGDAQLPRFGYDPQSQQCRQFAYGGLKGNPNNFQTQEECEQACLPNPCASGGSNPGTPGEPF
jgi:hypothetical protein